MIKKKKMGQNHKHSICIKGVNEEAIRTGATEPISKMCFEKNYTEMKKKRDNLQFKGFTVDLVKIDKYLDPLNSKSKRTFPKFRKKKQILCKRKKCPWNLPTWFSGRMVML